MKKRLIAVLLVLLLCAGSAAAEVLPRAGIDQGWKEYTGQSCVTGVILCDSLTLRAKPTWMMRSATIIRPRRCCSRICR